MLPINIDRFWYTTSKDVIQLNSLEVIEEALYQIIKCIRSNITNHSKLINSKHEITQIIR